MIGQTTEILIPTTKPPYHVPLMSEIAALAPNGFSVVSTFSGCGGSCLGYHMAGFRVLWANEFVPAVQQSYRANSDTILDPRDIRTIQPSEILHATGLTVGELDILDGSPPCQAFSTAGTREKGWGKGKTYEHGVTQKNEELFTDYIRILRGLKPKVFVAENVSGLLKGVAKGFFLEILRELKASGYVVQCKLLDAQWLGVPQMRQRAIFVGVRQDLGMPPVFPVPLPYRYSVRDALPWIVTQGDNGGFGNGAMREATIPSPTIGTETQAGNVRFPPSIVEARIFHNEGGTWSAGDITDTVSPTVRAHRMTHYVEQETDISRYAIGQEWDKLQPGEHSRKYRSLVKPTLEKPCPTLTGPPGAQFSPTAPSSSASVVHPTERRKFTIAELKRICAFPDDFILTGSYAQQWACLGNAVPPVMMAAIVREIRDRILAPLREHTA